MVLSVVRQRGKQRVMPRRAAAETEIALRDVTVRYALKDGSEKTVLERLSLEIRAGEFVAVLGETGCGKSTLLRMVLGQEFPSEGAVVVDGKPVRRIDARCGYVPQKYALFPDRTVMQNLMYGPENAFCGWMGRMRPRFWRFRRELRAEAAQMLLRMGLKSGDFGKYPMQLSGGMQQRVAIAQALLMRPPVLLMDEAFSALDPATRASLQQQLRDVWQETRPTVLFVTHNTSEALLLATRVLVLRPHVEGETETNVLMDMHVPHTSEPLAVRRRTREFEQLHEHVKQIAFREPAMEVATGQVQEMPLRAEPGHSDSDRSDSE